MFLDFALISGLLVVAHLLRSRVRLLPGGAPAHADPGGADRAGGGSRGSGPASRSRGTRAATPVMGRYPGELDRWCCSAPCSWAGGRTCPAPPGRCSASVGRHLLLQPVGLGRPVRPRAPVRGRRPHSAVPEAGGRALRADASRSGFVRGARDRHRGRVHPGRPGATPNALGVGYTFATIGLLAAVLGGRRGDQPRHAGGLDAPRRHPARAAGGPAARA